MTYKCSEGMGKQATDFLNMLIKGIDALEKRWTLILKLSIKDETEYNLLTILFQVHVWRNGAVRGHKHI